MKIVISLTTSPKRIMLLKTTINSILAQTVQPSKIILNIPEKFERTGEKYKIPNWCKSVPKLYINFCGKDYGPITKLLPTIYKLNKKNYKNLYIITIDDDIKYPENMIESYCEFLRRNPNIAVCGISGFNFINNKIIPVTDHSECHIIEAYASIAYLSSVFDDKFDQYLNEVLSDLNCKYSDDFIISNFLGLKRIPRMNLKLDNFNRQTFLNNGSILNIGLNDDALHKGGCIFTPISNGERYKEAARFLKSKNLLAF